MRPNTRPPNRERGAVLSLLFAFTGHRRGKAYNISRESKQGHRSHRNGHRGTIQEEPYTHKGTATGNRNTLKITATGKPYTHNGTTTEYTHRGMRYKAIQGSYRPHVRGCYSLSVWSERGHRNGHREPQTRPHDRP